MTLHRLSASLAIALCLAFSSSSLATAQEDTVEQLKELQKLREEVERLREGLTRQQLAESESRYQVTGQVRNRFEWIDADFTSGNADVQELLRARIRATGRLRHDTRLIVGVQDSRLWGEENSTFDGSGDHMDFHQAYAELEEISGESSDPACWPTRAGVRNSETHWRGRLAQRRTVL
ncbi:MAG: hypothetical protein VX733_09300 [Candidatus Latescibacterota bacterium]|nr:hypothetical protein [Candidatus Latescibacterota bacterium]